MLKLLTLSYNLYTNRPKSFKSLRIVKECIVSTMFVVEAKLGIKLTLCSLTGLNYFTTDVQVAENYCILTYHAHDL